MAANFRIQRHMRNGRLHLNLIGDFDGTSALELIHALEQNAGDAARIYVHTCRLASMAPFGEQVFKIQCRFHGKFGNKLVLTGKYGDRMAA